MIIVLLDSIPVAPNLPCLGCLPAGVDPNRGSEETVRSPGVL